MNPAQIVMREMQRSRGLEVVQFFAETIAQAGQPPHRHSHGEVLPFDQAG